jgi:hypothetical protein
MCASANIDVANPKFRAESKGKRLWICVKELHDIDGDKPVVDDITGPVINYYLFDTIPCLDPNRKPVVKGNPDDNEGIASGMFLDYRQINSKNKSMVEKMQPYADALHKEFEQNKKEVLKSMTVTEVDGVAVKVSAPISVIPKSDEAINWDEF